VQVLVVRHHPEDDPGLLRDAFARHGATVTTHLFPDEGRLPEPGEFDHVVVLGSKWSVYNDEAVGSWIEDELAWLWQAGSGAVPVLGICFGAQLLTSAFGGAVEPSPVYELGWTTIEPVFDDGLRNRAPTADLQEGAPTVGVQSGTSAASLPGPVIGRGPWFQFHGDRCVLPRHARLLARNDVCVQAFTIGANLGVQFHPEIDAGQLERWYADGGRAAAERLGLDPDVLLAQTKAEEGAARNRASELLERWLAHAHRSTVPQD
jgi:GMP synthase-like glutamine amidotransferase